MKALIITNGYSNNPNNIYKAKRLKEEFYKKRVDVDIVSALDLLPFSDGNNVYIKNLKQYAFAIDLDKDSYLADAIETEIPLFNSALALHLSDDKMTTILSLNKANVKTPLTVSAPLCYIDNPDDTKVEYFLKQVEEKLSYPLVFKKSHGSLGKQVELIHNHEELKETYLKNKGTLHLYEEFLSKHQGHDFRIMVIGNEVVAAMERINENDFRSNIALGGKGYDVTSTISNAFKETALRATKALHLDYAGIDVAISNEGEPRFLEANSNAFFTEIEKITGINITEKLVEYILTKINN